jgi:dolichyl-phosphate-mannose--protein O-mannosyl transferase
VALGLAVATKWSGVLAVPAAVAMAALTDVAPLRARWSSAAGDLARLTGLTAFAVLRLALPFAVVPAAVYLASYGPWLVSYEHTETARDRCEEGQCGTGLDDRLAGWWREQRELVSFHDRLQATHPDRSEAWQWPLLDQPVLMYLERCKQDATGCPFEADEQRRIIGLGTPALWWPALVAIPVLAAVAWRRRWWAGGAVVAFAVFQWAPWLLSPKPGFSFYLIPVAPFAALSLALVCSAMRPRSGRLLAIGLAVAALAAFAFWRPLYVGSVLDPDEIELRAWLASWD